MELTSPRPLLKRRSFIAGSVSLLTLPAILGVLAPVSQATSPSRDPVLVGRAVLPFDTLAGRPRSGAFVVPGRGVLNGVTFPLAGQPVAGFSAVVDGRRPGEFLAMADNGFGTKDNSKDFLIRAYYLRPKFKTADGGSGGVRVNDYVAFRDPYHRIGFPIVNKGTGRRLLTGGDIDPESLQRGRDGDLWVGDEFGPWVLHFDARGVLLDAPFAMPGNLRSPNNPFLGGAPATQPNSRGLEGMAISPNGKHLYAALEGATEADPDPLRRYVYEFSTRREAFTGRVLQYRTEAAGNLVADLWAVDRHRIVVIERDLGSGVSALFRRIYLVDLRHTDRAGFLVKTELVDLTRVPDPDLVSLPALHPGDLGLGDPFWVMCESVEAVHLVKRNRLLVGCDNNLPNSGRNPGRPDDSEFILVKVPRMSGGYSVRGGSAQVPVA
jgi:glycerophosphoryl diester phosphodiesterase